MLGYPANPKISYLELTAVRPLASEIAPYCKAATRASTTSMMSGAGPPTHGPA